MGLEVGEGQEQGQGEAATGTGCPSALVQLT